MNSLATLIQIVLSFIEARLGILATVHQDY